MRTVRRRSGVVVLVGLLALLGYLAVRVAVTVRQSQLDHGLMRAVESGDTGRVQDLLASGADPNVRMSEDPPLSIREVLWSVVTGHIRKPPDTSKRATALIRAAWLGQTRHQEIALLLLQRGADTNLTMNGIDEGVTALDYAVWNSPELMEPLLRRGADPNARCGRGKWTPFMDARALREPRTMQLFARYGADLKLKDAHDQTTLIRYAQQCYGRASLDTPALILEAGVNIDDQDNWGQTAVMIAAQNGDTKLVDFLVGRGARLDLEDCLKRSALTLALGQERHDTAEYLVRAGATR